MSFSSFILNTYHYPGKSAIHTFADLTLKPLHIAGNGKTFVYEPERNHFRVVNQDAHSQLTHFVTRVICTLAAILVFPLTLLGCAIKLLYSEQEKIDTLRLRVIRPPLPRVEVAPPPQNPPQAPFAKVEEKRTKVNPLVLPPPEVEHKARSSEDQKVMHIRRWKREPVVPQILAQVPPLEVEDAFTDEELAFDWENNPEVFLRSRCSFNHIAKGLEGFDPKDPKFLMIKGVKHQIIYTGVRDFANQPLASVGCAHDREILVLDPQKSPNLERCYQGLVTKLRQKTGTIERRLATEVVLKELLSHVLLDLFPRSGAFWTQKLVAASFTNPDHLKLKYRPLETEIEKEFPVLSLEQITTQKCGCCRHHALASCYLLSRLIKDGFIHGTVYHIRDNVPGGAHSWAAFIPERIRGNRQQKWHLDTMWRVCLDFSEPKNLIFLKQKYSEQAINNQIQKTNERL